ncbi:MAG TPA: sugar transferase [Steroidobacteraceae bacterium]|nr:sugar transferase [Steroidobacteraceae bacterium]
MSTQPANEAKSPNTATARAVPSRPHLVTGETRVHERLASVAIDADVAPEARPLAWQGTEAHAWSESITQFGGRARSRTSVNAGLKRVVDLLGALILAVVFSPLMLLIVLMVRRNGGSVIYKHRRVGRDGRMFDCLKFRTMVLNADEVLLGLLESDPALRAEWIRDHKLRDDPRITRLGRFLRRTSLDELPQIWNVVRGEMSLVGPRPVVREELLRYGRNVGAYLAAKPGITGLWQVTGRNDTNYRRRVILDTYYVCNHNLLLDTYILIRTVGVVIGGSGAY